MTNAIVVSKSEKEDVPPKHYVVIFLPTASENPNFLEMGEKLLEALKGSKFEPLVKNLTAQDQLPEPISRHDLDFVKIVEGLDTPEQISDWYTAPIYSDSYLISREGCHIEAKDEWFDVEYITCGSELTVITEIKTVYPEDEDLEKKIKSVSVIDLLSKAVEEVYGEMVGLLKYSPTDETKIVIESNTFVPPGVKHLLPVEVQVENWEDWQQSDLTNFVSFLSSFGAGVATVAYDHFNITIISSKVTETTTINFLLGENTPNRISFDLVIKFPV